MRTLSIYILNYNYEEYLRECINSIILSAASFRDKVELAFFDDCSSDNSALVIEEYKHQFDIIHLNAKNIGLIKLSNIAVKKLTGDYIVRIDADDFVEIDFVANYLSILNDGIYDIVYSDYNFVNKQSLKISTYHRSDLSNHMRFDKPFHGAFTAISHSFLKQIEYYDEDFSKQDGYYIWLLSRINDKRIGHLRMPLFNYRQHVSSLSFNKRNLLNERYQINLKYLKSRFHDYNIPVIIPLANDQYLFERVELIKCYSLLELRFIVLLAEDTYYKISSYLSSEIEIYFRASNDLFYISDVKSCVRHFNLKDFLVLEPNYPNLNKNSIIDVLLMAKFNDYDACFSMYIETNTFFINKGLALRPFNDTNQIRFERNELYRMAGGIKYFKNLNIYNDFNSGAHSHLGIGHSEIDEIAAIRIQHLNLPPND